MKRRCVISIPYIFIFLAFWVQTCPTSFASPLPLGTADDDDDACAPTRPAGRRRRTRYSALACWLQKLQVPLPKQSFHEGIITLKLENFVCSNFTITGLDSEFVPANHASSSSYAQIAMAVHDVTVICQGAYHSSGGFSGKVHAIVGARHADIPAVQLVGTVVAAAGNHSFVQPQHLQTTQCATDMAVNDLHFSGSLSAHTIQLFARKIRSSVTKTLSTKICPLISDTLEPMMDDYIAKLNQWLEPFLSDDVNNNGSRNFADPYANTHIVSHDSSFVRDESVSIVRKLEATPSDFERRLVARPQSDVLHRRHHSQNEIVKWSRDAPALVGFLQRLNDGLGYFLRRGVLQHWLPNHDGDGTFRSCGFFFDGINSLVHSILYDNHGWLDVPLLRRWQNLHFVIPQYAAVRLQIKNVSLHGMDQWEALQLFVPIRDERFLTQLDAKNVTVRARFHLMLSSVPDGLFQGDDLDEDFLVDLNLANLSTSMEFLLNVDKESLQKKLSVGTIWDIFEGVLARNVSLPHLACLQESIEKFLVTELSAVWAIQSMSFQPDFNGLVGSDSLEEDVDHLINNAMQVIWSEFPEMVTQSVKGMAKGPVVTSLNEFLERITTTNSTCTLSNDKKYSPHLIDFTNIGWVKKMNDFFARSSTRRHINSYLQCGADYLASAVLERIPNNLFQVHELSFEGLGHLQELYFFSSQPGQNSLTNGFLFQSDNSSSPCLNMRLSAGVAQASAEVNVSFRWDDIAASSSVAAQYDLGRLKKYPLFQVLEHGQCLLVPMDEFDVYNVSDRVGLMKVDLSATVDYGNSATASIAWNSSTSLEAQNLASTLWSWAMNVSRDMLSVGTVSAISQAGRSCSGRTEEYNGESSSEDYLSISLVVCAIILLAQPAILLIQADTGESAEIRRHEEEQQMYEDALLGPLVSDSEHSSGPTLSAWENGPKQNLLNASRIPGALRIGVPSLIMCTMVLLLCSNLSVGAEVKLMGYVSGQPLEIPSLFTFSLYNTANEMLQARIYSLLFLVVVFSGLWPYLKLALMLFGWLQSLSLQNLDGRERLFFALDALGKFSLVDTYVLVLMVVAFRYHLELESEVELDVFVAPAFGFYGFLIGTVLSLILSHILVFCHRRSVTEPPEELSSQESVLLQHCYCTETGKQSLSFAARIVLLAVFVCTSTLLAIGVTRESFIFEFGGIAGALIGPRKDVAYSLISLGRALPASVENSEGFAILGLQAAYFFFAAFSPFACLAFLFVLFTCPLSFKKQLLLLTLAEIANAWSAVEVFCLSIVAALLEISTFASFIVGDKCELIDSILRNNFDKVADTCYSVSASVSWNAVFLLIGVILNSCVVSFALRLAHTATREKLREGTISMRQVDVLGCHQTSFVEKLSFWKGTQWILEPLTE